MPIATVETGQVGVGVMAATGSQRGEVDAGRPAFGALAQGGDRRGLDALARCGLDQGRGLVLVQAQVRRSQLGELTAGPHPRQRQRRVGTGGERQVQRRREVGQEELDRLVDLAVTEGVIVIDHEHPSVVERRQVVEQHRQHHADEVHAGNGQGSERRCAGVGVDGAQGGDDIPPEPGGLVIGMVDTEPCDAAPLARVAGPSGKEAGLSPSHRGGDHGEAGVGVGS